MPTVDPSARRFLALLLAPLFLIIKSKLGIEVPESVQDLLIIAIITYVGGSHFKAAIIGKAEAAGAAGAAAVTDPKAVLDAAIATEKAKP